MDNEIAESEVIEMDVELQVYDKVSADVDAAMERCDKVVLKYDTPKDITLSKSWIFQNLNKLNPLIKQAGKLGKAEALKFTRAMTAKEKELLEKVAKQIEVHSAPIKVIEDAEAAKKAEAERIEQKRVQAELDAKQAEFDQKQAELEAKEAELKAKQAEIDRKEREARIAEEAKREAEAAQAQKLIDATNARKAIEEKAKQDAIAAENARKQAIVDAENAKAAAVQKVKDEVVAKAAEKEQLLMEEQLAEKIEAARITDDKLKRKEEAEMAETARINDTAHRLAVNTEVYNKIKYVVYTAEQHAQMAAVNTEDRSLVVAKGVFKALQKNNIPYTRIQY